MAIEIHEPELEELIRERMEAGHFQTVEDFLLQTLKSSGSVETIPAPKQNIVDFLLESPLRGSGQAIEC